MFSWNRRQESWFGIYQLRSHKNPLTTKGTKVHEGLLSTLRVLRGQRVLEIPGSDYLATGILVFRAVHGMEDRRKDVLIADGGVDHYVI